MKARWCDRGLFVSPCHYTVCATKKVFRRELRRLKVQKAERPPFVSPGANATTHFFESGARHAAIVCIEAGEHGSIEIAAMLVHEAVHIWQNVRTIVGEEKPSSEFEAYAIQAISQELMTEFERQTR